MDVREFTIKIRLEAAKEAQQRTRLVFFASIIVSLTMITAGWNAYLSWYRIIAFDLQSLSKNEGTATLQKELLAEWVKSRMISVSLLGIKVGVDDAPQLGALTLLVISIWFFFTTRRENYTIGYLLRETKNEEHDVRWMIFHGVISFSVFTNITNVDQPLRSLRGPRPKDNSFGFARWAYRALYYLPSFSIAMLLVLDVLSVFYLASPFRDSHDRPLISQLKWADLAWSFIWWALASILGVLTTVLCWRARKFSNATEQVLTEYWEEVRPSMHKPTGSSNGGP